jgi:hypothetical protein
MTGISQTGSGPIFAKNENCWLAATNFATVCSAPISGPHKPSSFHLKSNFHLGENWGKDGLGCLNKRQPDGPNTSPQAIAQGG